jgi:16S rRNA (cytosine967-C5)-methyltransferase
MTPSARLAAVMEIMDTLLMEWHYAQPRPVEHLLRHYNRERRYIGGGDRRHLQDTVFAILRRLGTIEARLKACNWQKTGRSIVLGFLRLEGANPDEIAAQCGGTTYATPPLTAEERQFLTQWQEEQPAAIPHALPLWLMQQLVEDHGEADAAAISAELQQPAPLDLRVNTLKMNRDEAIHSLAQEGIVTTPIAGLKNGLEAPRNASILASKSFAKGLIEIQSRSSQAVIENLLGVLQNGEKGKAMGGKAPTIVIDYCAGAGGKSLALAALLQNDCHIIAFDENTKRLAELSPRAKRAEASCIQIWKGQETDLPQADFVLVDAPCSGTGTIRRHPDLPWRLSPERIARYVELQQQILRQAVHCVKPNGSLYYVTCSLLENENLQCVNDFLRENPNLRVVNCPQIWNKEAVQPVPFLQFLPHQQDADGFFAMLLQKIA